MASQVKREGHDTTEALQATQSAQKQNGGEGSPPVYSRRLWTGSANVELAIFARAVESNGSSFTAYSTVLRRTYKDGDEYKETRFLRPEDLLVAAHALQQAYAFITSEQQKA